MSRSGYDGDYDYDCEDQWRINLYAGRVKKAANGVRGQKMYRDMLDALDAMPDRRLVANDLETESGEVCAFGALGLARGMTDLRNIDPEDVNAVASKFDVAPCLVREVVSTNDEMGPHMETPEDRFIRVRTWVASQIVSVPA